MTLEDELLRKISGRKILFQDDFSTPKILDIDTLEEFLVFEKGGAYQELFDCKKHVLLFKCLNNALQTYNLETDERKVVLNRDVLNAKLSNDGTKIVAQEKDKISLINNKVNTLNFYNQNEKSRIVFSPNDDCAYISMKNGGNSIFDFNNIEIKNDAPFGYIFWKGEELLNFNSNSILNQQKEEIMKFYGIESFKASPNGDLYSYVSPKEKMLHVYIDEQFKCIGYPICCQYKWVDNETLVYQSYKNKPQQGMLISVHDIYKVDLKG
ncbi:hypothetical protein KY334_07745, partial [Candidatus Woesearchaeota archaeon]|nr:hypothetical protein [Candidatus Woesearchaeota archaeon]